MAVVLRFWLFELAGKWIASQVDAPRHFEAESFDTLVSRVRSSLKEEYGHPDNLSSVIVIFEWCLYFASEYFQSRLGPEQLGFPFMPQHVEVLIVPRPRLPVRNSEKLRLVAPIQKQRKRRAAQARARKAGLKFTDSDWPPPFLTRDGRPLKRLNDLVNYISDESGVPPRSILLWDELYRKGVLKTGTLRKRKAARRVVTLKSRELSN